MIYDKRRTFFFPMRFALLLRVVGHRDKDICTYYGARDCQTGGGWGHCRRTMDNGFEDAPGPQLSYDDLVPYHEQVSSLAERISSTKVYLLADASNAKRKPAEDSPHSGEDEMETDQGTCSLSRPFPRLLSHPQQTPFSVQTLYSSKALPSPTSPLPAYSTTQPILTFIPSV